MADQHISEHISPEEQDEEAQQARSITSEMLENPMRYKCSS
jgi:hypothetical protein